MTKESRLIYYNENKEKAQASSPEHQQHQQPNPSKERALLKENIESFLLKGSDLFFIQQLLKGIRENMKSSSGIFSGGTWRESIKQTFESDGVTSSKIMQVGHYIRDCEKMIRTIKTANTKNFLEIPSEIVSLLKENGVDFLQLEGNKLRISKNKQDLDKLSMKVFEFLRQNNAYSTAQNFVENYALTEYFDQQTEKLPPDIRKNIRKQASDEVYKQKWIKEIEHTNLSPVEQANLTNAAIKNKERELLASYIILNIENNLKGFDQEILLKYKDMMGTGEWHNWSDKTKDKILNTAIYAIPAIMGGGASLASRTGASTRTVLSAVTALPSQTAAKAGSNLFTIATKAKKLLLSAEVAPYTASATAGIGFALWATNYKEPPKLSLIEDLDKIPTTAKLTEKSTTSPEKTPFPSGFPSSGVKLLSQKFQKHLNKINPNLNVENEIQDFTKFMNHINKIIENQKTSEHINLAGYLSRVEYEQMKLKITPNKQSDLSKQIDKNIQKYQRKLDKFKKSKESGNSPPQIFQEIWNEVGDYKIESNKMHQSLNQGGNCEGRAKLIASWIEELYPDKEVIPMLEYVTMIDPKTNTYINHVRVVAQYNNTNYIIDGEVTYMTLEESQTAILYPTSILITGHQKKNTDTKLNLPQGANEIETPKPEDEDKDRPPSSRLIKSTGLNGRMEQAKKDPLKLQKISINSSILSTEEKQALRNILNPPLKKETQKSRPHNEEKIKMIAEQQWLFKQAIEEINNKYRTGKVLSDEEIDQYIRGIEEIRNQERHSLNYHNQPIKFIFEFTQKNNSPALQPTQQKGLYRNSSAIQLGELNKRKLEQILKLGAFGDTIKITGLTENHATEHKDILPSAFAVFDDIDLPDTKKLNEEVMKFIQDKPHSIISLGITTITPNQLKQINSDEGGPPLDIRNIINFNEVAETLTSFDNSHLILRVQDNWSDESIKFFFENRKDNLRVDIEMSPNNVNRNSKVITAISFSKKDKIELIIDNLPEENLEELNIIDPLYSIAIKIKKNISAKNLNKIIKKTIKNHPNIIKIKGIKHLSLNYLKEAFKSCENQSCPLVSFDNVNSIEPAALEYLKSNNMKVAFEELRWRTEYTHPYY